MANEFDAYREALVVEYTTVWPEEYDDWSQADRLKAEAQVISRLQRVSPVGLRSPAHRVCPADHRIARGSRAAGGVKK